MIWMALAVNFYGNQRNSNSHLLNLSANLGSILSRPLTLWCLFAQTIYIRPIIKLFFDLVLCLCPLGESTLH